MTDSSEPDWYLREWAKELERRQADLVAHLGWPKGRVSKIWNSQQPYKRDLVNILARWLGIRPYELLMPPPEAMALRRLRETAAQIVGETQPAEPINTPATDRQRRTS